MIIYTSELGYNCYVQALKEEFKNVIMGKQTLTQKAILPRNWLFGRLAGISSNLKNVAKHQGNLTASEEIKLKEACKIIDEVIRNKKESSEAIKSYIRVTNGKR